MKNNIFLVLFLFFVCNVLAINKNNQLKALRSIDSIGKKAAKDPLNKLFETAIKEYSNYEYDKAIVIWKEVLKKANNKKDSTLIVKTTINIGSSYNALGYHKTALNYFIKANKTLETFKQKTEPYWTNHINIGVCYMSLEQYDTAKKYFDKTINFNPYISFVKKLNLAKWYASKDQKSAFFELQKQVSFEVKDYPMYKSIWDEVQLDFLINWKDKARLRLIIEEFKNNYKEQNLYLKLLINEASIIVYGHPLETINNILKYREEVLSSNDYYLKDLYYKVLKDFYYEKQDLANFYKYVDLWQKNNESLTSEKNMLYVEDFKVAHDLDEMKNTVDKMQLKNQIVENKLSQSDLKLRLSVLMIIMGFGIVFLLSRNYKKTKKIQELILVKTKNDLIKKEVEKIELSESLKETSEELVDSVINIKKVMLLKKQLENIIDDNKSEHNEEEALKQVKVCLNVFFDNYRELNQIMQKKLNVEKIINQVKLISPDLNDRELKIIEYIALQFTTKEIAVLVDKSDKSIEYYRTQIRKKINLIADKTLEEYLTSLANGS